MKNRKISRRKGWTILMVGVNGQIKTIRFLRTKMMIGLIICILALLSTMIIGQMYFQVLKENKTLYETLAIKKAVFGEKGIIRMPCNPPQNTYDLSVDNYMDPSFRKIFSKSYSLDPPMTFNISKTIDIIPDVQPDIEKNSRYDLKVQATDIKMLINSKNNRIGFSFILRNAAKAKKPVSGTSFVVLKNGENSIAYPSIKLRRGKPVNFRKGRPFYVSRFKTVRHRLEDLEHFDKFTEVTILVYSKYGQLLIDKTVPIHMSL